MKWQLTNERKQTSREHRACASPREAPRTEIQLSAKHKPAALGVNSKQTRSARGFCGRVRSLPAPCHGRKTLENAEPGTGDNASRIPIKPAPAALSARCVLASRRSRALHAAVTTGRFESGSGRLFRSVVRTRQVGRGRKQKRSWFRVPWTCSSVTVDDVMAGAGHAYHFRFFAHIARLRTRVDILGFVL